VHNLNALSHHNVSHPDDRVVNFWIDPRVRRLADSSAPDLVRDVDHEVQLRPLFVYGENVAFLRAGEAALRTQAELIKPDIVLRFGDPALDIGFAFERARLRCDEAEHNLFPLRYVGITTNDLSPLIVPGDESERWALHASESWREGTVKLAVHPGAGKTENIWKPENFAAVVNMLGRARELTLVVVQGPADASTVQAFTNACDVQGTIVKGRSITDVAALLKRADLVLCNDTGVMHVACAAGARVLAIFGLTDPVRWAPRSPGLRMVRAPGGDLRALEPAVVAREAEDYLRGRNAGSA